MINASCCTTNDAVSVSDQVDETQSYMQPVVALEMLNLTR